MERTQNEAALAKSSNNWKKRNRSVRQIARMILEMQGYKVLQANGGREAIEVAENTNESIHLLITDVVIT